MKPTTSEVRDRAMEITQLDQFGAIDKFGATVALLAVEMDISESNANDAVTWAARRKRDQVAVEDAGYFTLRVRLTENQRIRLKVMADRETGGNVSEYVRRAVFS